MRNVAGRAMLGDSTVPLFTQRSSFAQTTLGWSPRCYIPSFAEIGLPVLEKKIFECFFFFFFFFFFFIYGRGGHLGYVTQISRSNFCSPYPWKLHIKFGFDWPNGFSEEDI